MSIVSMIKASHRNTPSNWVNVGSVRILFSYQTPVAMQYGQVRVRKENTWGPTTGRHMSDAGVRDFKVVSDEDFDNLLLNSVRETVRLGD